MMGGMFSSSKPTENVKALNAKKLDINFDNDDFFNSFEPNNQKNTTDNSKSKFVSKLQEVDDPFDLVAKPSTNNNTH